MEASNSDTWLETPLLCQASQADHAAAQSYSLYTSDILPLHQPGHHRSHVAENEPGICSALCQPFDQNLGPNFDVSSQLHPEIPCFPDCQPFPRSMDQEGCRCIKGVETAGTASARKVHKADREKLRRDRLNEQFTELANALDSDRPKNDKATILGDCAQNLTDLRAEVKRLKVDNTTLLDESRDLTHEKSELPEEKTALKNETEQLQCQLQQRIRLLLSWAGMDPSFMMGAAPFPYSLPVPAAASAPPNSQQFAAQTQSQPPVVAPAPYIPPHGAFAIHPGFQAYTMVANRPSNLNLPFFPYPPFPIAPLPVTSHSHVEKPFAHNPSALHPVPSYAICSQLPLISQPVVSIELPTQTSDILSSAAALKSMNDEPTHIGVYEKAQKAEGEDQKTASLLPDSRCRNDNLHEKSSDGTSQVLETDLQLQSSFSVTLHDSSHAVEQESVSYDEIKKEKARRVTESLSLSCTAQDVIPAIKSQTKVSACITGKDNCDPGASEFQELGKPLQHVPTVNPPEP